VPPIRFSLAFLHPSNVPNTHHRITPPLTPSLTPPPSPLSPPTLPSVASDISNITFRNIYMPNTYKGIYMKFRGNGNVVDVLYENIIMDAPEQ
jgi:hypothetical protein